MGVLMKNKINIFLSLLLGFVGGVFIKTKHFTLQLNKAKVDSDKHLILFLMMNQWVKIKQEGKNLAEYFRKAGYKNIAVYGMSYAGETFVNELKETGIQVIYGIDKNTDAVYPGMRIVSMEDRLENVDAIVVTAISFFDEIKESLREKMDCPIISLEYVLYEV